MQDNWRDSTYSITMNARGQRFLGADTGAITASAVIFIDGAASSGSKKIAYASSSINASVTTSFNARRGKFASASLDSSAVVLTIAIERQLSQIQINVQSSTSFNARKLVFASSNINGELSTVFNARKTYYGVISASGGLLLCEAFVGVKAEASLTIEGYKVTVAQEILFPLISISASTSVSVSAYEILYASSTTSSELNATVNSFKIATAEISYSGETNVTTSGTNIKFAVVSLTSTTVNVTIGTEIQIARISILAIATSLVAQTVKFSAGQTEDTESIRTMLLIDNKPLTEHNRTLDSSIIQSLNENTNWSSRRSRYYRSSSGRKTFNINWRMVPNNRRRTADLKFGRDFINSIGSDPDSHTLKVINLDSNNTTPYTEEEYTVIVKSYSESLIRRDETDNSYWWDCNLTLEEV